MAVRRPVGEAAAPLRQAQAYLLTPAVAGKLAADLADVEVEVARLRRQLERRATHKLGPRLRRRAGRP